MIRVLFVCLGNICRSPMAEAVLRHMAEREGLSSMILVDSAGTGGWHIGEPPHPGTRERLKRESISDKGIFARLLTREDIDSFDYVIGMDEENLSGIRRLCTQDTKDKPCLLADFLPDKRWPNGRSVPDPWYTGNFDRTYELVWEGCSHLLAVIRQRISAEGVIA